MAYTILTESYKRRLPLITATADSADDLATLGTDYAEGSTCVIGETTYKLDKVQGWTDGSGSGSSDLPDPSEANDGDVLTVDDGAWVAAAPSGGGSFIVHITEWQSQTAFTVDKSGAEIVAAAQSGLTPFLVSTEEDMPGINVDHYIPLLEIYYGEAMETPIAGATFYEVIHTPQSSSVSYARYSIGDTGEKSGLRTEEVGVFTPSQP